MNNKFLIWTSLSIALLLHLAFFSLTTFVFPIDPAALKPKFFFLGTILSQSEVKQASFSTHTSTSNTMLGGAHLTGSNLKEVSPEITDQAENPFAIGTIKKPLIPQTNTSQKKIIIKSTFETHPTDDATEEDEAKEHLNSELKIQPYKSLQFRSPKHD